MRLVHGIALTALINCGMNVAIAAQGSCCEFGLQAACEKACYPNTIVEQEKKSCYFVECREICIPAIRFPWVKYDDGRCGKVRTVKVLKQRSFFCDRYKCKWNIEPCCTQDDSCVGCANGVCNGDCQKTAPAAGQSTQRTPKRFPPIGGLRRFIRIGATAR